MSWKLCIFSYIDNKLKCSLGEKLWIVNDISLKTQNSHSNLIVCEKNGFFVHFNLVVELHECIL